MSQNGVEAPIAPPIERPIQFSSEMVRAILAGAKTQTRRAIIPTPDMIRRIKHVPHPFRENEPIRCKFGNVGDRLWVRERWAMDDDRVVYAADQQPSGRHRWRPSYVMPRLASRLLLDITACRIERLASITRADARSEGCPAEHADDPVAWLQALWDSLAKPEHAWEQNPWVWVMGFRVSSHSNQD